MRGLLANVKTKIKKSSRKSIHAARGHQKKTENKKAKSKNDCRSTPWDRKLSKSSSAYACKKKVTLNTNHHVLSCTPTHITLQPLDDNRRRSTTTVANGSNALLTLLQSVHQGDDNSGTRRTDRLRVFFFRVSSRNFSPAKKKKEDDVRDRERRHHL